MIYSKWMFVNSIFIQLKTESGLKIWNRLEFLEENDLIWLIQIRIFWIFWQIEFYQNGVIVPSLHF